VYSGEIPNSADWSVNSMIDYPEVRVNPGDHIWTILYIVVQVSLAQRGTCPERIITNSGSLVCKGNRKVR